MVGGSVGRGAAPSRSPAKRPAPRKTQTPSDSAPRRRAARACRNIRRAVSFSASASAGPSAEWDAATDRLVRASSVPFSVLVLPQVLQNFQSIAAGRAHELSIISWEVSLASRPCRGAHDAGLQPRTCSPVPNAHPCAFLAIRSAAQNQQLPCLFRDGRRHYLALESLSSVAALALPYLPAYPDLPVEQGYATALLGNSLLCVHFATRSEDSAVGVQVIGILNNLLVLGQVRMYATGDGGGGRRRAAVCCSHKWRATRPAEYEFLSCIIQDAPQTVLPADAVRVLQRCRNKRNTSRWQRQGSCRRRPLCSRSRCRC